MSKMFTGSGRLFQEVQTLPLDEEALRDIERRIKVQPHFLGEPLVIVAESMDFPQIVPEETHNLVALDTSGRAVIIGLNMGVADTLESMHTQQLASHVASLSTEDLGKIARSFISRPANDTLRRAWEELDVEMSEEAVELSSLLASTFERDAEDYSESINDEQRIVITSEEFTSRLVHMIEWLGEGGIGMTGLRYTRFLVGGQEVYQAEQVVPRTDPAVDAPDQRTAPISTEAPEPWRTKGRLYHLERLTPAVGSMMDQMLVATRESTFSINWSHKYYFWVRGEKQNLRVRTYYRDRLEIGFYNTAPRAVEEYIARYGISAEVATVGGYSDSPFVGVTADTSFDERWSAMLNDWLSGTTPGDKSEPSEDTTSEDTTEEEEA